MAACSDSDDDAVGTEDVSVAFTLTVAEAATTRGGENEGWDNYNPGEDGILNDNSINTNDVVIAIYDDKGNKVDDI